MALGLSTVPRHALGRGAMRHVMTLCRCTVSKQTLGRGTLLKHVMELGRGTESRHALGQDVESRHALGQDTFSRHIMALGRGTVARNGTRLRHRE